MNHYLYKFSAMTSPCELHIYHTNPTESRAIASKVLTMVKSLERRYNFYDPNSFLSQINQRKIKKLDRESIDLLRRSKLFYQKTEGVFDITMGTLRASLEHEHIQKLEEEQARLRPFLGVEHFKIQRNQIYFDNPYTQIDLGGFVKEYAVDQTVKLLKREGVRSALVNFGGDIYALGKKPNGEAFSIGIKNPLKPQEHIIHIDLQDQALTTSASYERYHTIEGKNYSHLLSNGDALQSEVISATVISPSVVESGVFSTALMIRPSIAVSLEKYLIRRDLTILS